MSGIVAIKYFFALIGMFASYLMGGFDDSIKILAIFIVLDYITGVIKAFYKKELSSAVGLMGILRKVSILIVICIVCLIDGIICADGLLRAGAICYYIANECLSIIENIGVLGVPIPDKLKNALEELRGDDDA